MEEFPTPSEEGIEKMRTYYQQTHGMDLTSEEAYQVLYGVMRFLYLTRDVKKEGQPSLLKNQDSDTEALGNTASP